MTTKDVSRASNLPAKTISDDEYIALVRPPREITPEDCCTLVPLRQDRVRASADEKALAAKRPERIALKIPEVQALKSTLETCVARCRGDDHPECQIFGDLAGRQALAA